MPPERRRLVVDIERAPAVRAAVGPAAWFVLEALAERCPPRSPAAELEVSTRQLSTVLGLSKDSVARALRVLASHGLVGRTDHRDSRTGRFLASIYVVELTAAGLAVEVGASATPHDWGVGVDRHADVPATPVPIEPDRWWTQLDLLSDGRTSS